MVVEVLVGEGGDGSVRTGVGRGPGGGGWTLFRALRETRC